MTWSIHPTTPADVDACIDTLPAIIVDRWREGLNRRSYVAVDDSGAIVGTARGIDNTYHPKNRLMLFQALPGLVDPDLDEALVRAVLEDSALPVDMKIDSVDARLWEVARRCCGVVTNICPPCIYAVDEALRAWARTRVGSAEPITMHDLEESLALYAQCYWHQHIRWNTPADPPTLMELNREDFLPEPIFELAHSFQIKRDDTMVAQSLLWLDELNWGVNAGLEGAHEVSYQALPYEGPTYRADLEAVLAATILSCPDGMNLAIDSHATETIESALTNDMPGASGELTAMGLFGSAVGVSGTRR